MRPLFGTSGLTLAAWGLLSLAPLLLAQSDSPTRHRGYVNGFRDGYDYGTDVHGRGAPLDERATKQYRDADHGYVASFGPREEYQVGYREGYRLGAQDGFSGISVRRDEILRDNPEQREEKKDLAAVTGYHDGVTSAIRDLESHQPAHPETHDYWKSGSHGYQPSWGSEEAYRKAYRTAFESGYRDTFNNR